MARGFPVISVDTKKKELVGQFKNAGQTWCEQAEKVNDHDFPSEAVGRAAPYGIYDPERNEGHVCVTTSSDTADLAVDALCDWWRLSQPHDPPAKRLLIEADSGGSNAARSRRYKKRLQDFADESGLEITVSHYPPGTSKWNPIEHRCCRDKQVHFGLGAATVAEMIEIRWPSGVRQTLKGIRGDRIFKVEEPSAGSDGKRPLP